VLLVLFICYTPFTYLTTPQAPWGTWNRIQVSRMNVILSQDRTLHEIHSCITYSFLVRRQSGFGIVFHSKALALVSMRFILAWSSLPLNSIGHILSISCFARRKAPSKTELTHLASSSVYMLDGAGSFRAGALHIAAPRAERTQPIYFTDD
jgi:hypothetical protein